LEREPGSLEPGFRFEIRGKAKDKKRKYRKVVAGKKHALKDWAQTDGGFKTSSNWRVP